MIPKYSLFYGKNTHDVIVIGAGHNGLTAASYMAKQD